VDLNLQFFKPQKLTHAVPFPDLWKPNDGWGELNKQINGIMAYNIWRKRAGPGWQEKDRDVTVKNTRWMQELPFTPKALP
jgi:hypothetical protein